MKILLLATLLVLAESAAQFKKFCRYFQSAEHRALDSRIESLEEYSNDIEKEINDAVDHMIIAVFNCCHYRGEFVKEAGEEEYLNFRERNKKGAYDYDCQDPTEEINAFRMNNPINPPKPKGFVPRMFLSNTEMKKEFDNRIELKDKLIKEHEFIMKRFRGLRNDADTNTNSRLEIFTLPIIIKLQFFSEVVS
jgi:hypothetical protein